MFAKSLVVQQIPHSVFKWDILSSNPTTPIIWLSQKKKKKFKIVWIVYVNVQIHCKIELLVNLFLLNKISYSKDTIAFWFGESNKSLQSQIFENMMLGNLNVWESDYTLLFIYLISNLLRLKNIYIYEIPFLVYS